MKLGNFGGNASVPSRFININHADGMFEVPGFFQDNGYIKGLPRSSNSVIANTDEINVVILGLVRQREMWTEDRKRACESPDAVTGYPTPNFPEAHKTVGGKLACHDCPFHKWQNNKPPLCKELWILPVAFVKQTDSGPQYSANVYYLKFTYASIRNIEKYLTPFRDQKIPAYTETTCITLSRASRDGNRFAIANFSKSAVKDFTADQWPYFSQLLKDAREYLLTPPVTATNYTPMSMGRSSMVVPTQHPD